MNNRIYSKRQLGLSIIELLIAMIIGVFLLAGIASSYISSKKASVERDQLSSIEDNGRIALEIISNVIEHAGYLPPNPGADPNFLPFITNPNDVLSGKCTDGTQSVVNKALFTANRVVRDNSLSDSLAVIHYSDDRVFLDCAGNRVPNSCRLAPVGSVAKAMKPKASRVYSSFFLDRSRNQLKCVGSRSIRAEVIAEGIENIQFLYGVKIDDTGVKRYLNATDLAISRLWRNVVSMQVAVLVRSLKPVKKHPESKDYTLLDQSVTTANDRFSRAVFTTTVRLRNN